MASSWQVPCRVAPGLSLLGPPVTVATAQEPTPTIAVVDHYRRARARTMEAGATEADAARGTPASASSARSRPPASSSQRSK